MGPRGVDVMTDTRVYKSFAEAARALGYEHLDEPFPEDRPEQAPGGAACAAIDLASLLAGLDAASATLATVVRQDERARALAADELAEHDALAAALAEAERALERAAAVRGRAEELAEAAFAEEARAAAGAVASEARAAEASAARLVGGRSEERRGG